MSMINPVANQVSQPWLSQEQTSQQNISQNVRAGQEASTVYAPKSEEWIKNNPVVETKEKERLRDKHPKAKTECETCNNRRYQDGSDDHGVSFQTPQHISPEAAGPAVAGHEAEHVSRNQMKATVENKEMVYQRVALHTDICPECGKVYVSGGTTTSMTREKDNAASAQPLPFAIPGNNLDILA